MEPRLQQQPEARAAALHRLPQLVREPAGRSRYTLLWPCEYLLYCSAYCSFSCGQVGDVVWEPCKARVQGSQQKGESTQGRDESHRGPDCGLRTLPLLLTKVR